MVYCECFNRFSSFLSSEFAAALLKQQFSTLSFALPERLSSGQEGIQRISSLTVPLGTLWKTHPFSHSFIVNIAANSD